MLITPKFVLMVSFLWLWCRGDVASDIGSGCGASSISILATVEHSVGKWCLNVCCGFSLRSWSSIDTSLFLAVPFLNLG